MTNAKSPKPKLTLKLPMPEGITLNIDISSLGTLARFPPNSDHIFTLYGRIMLEWCCAETELDYLIHKTHYREFVANIDPAGKPRSLNNKITFLRKVFRKDGPLSEISEVCRDILTDTLATGKERGILAHCSIAEIKSNNGEFHLEVGSLEGNYKAFSESYLHELLERILIAQNDLMAIAWNYSSHFRKVRPER